MSYHISWVRGSDHCRLQVVRPMTIEDLCADTGIAVHVLYEANPGLTGDYVMDGETLVIPMASWPEAEMTGAQPDSEGGAGEYIEPAREAAQPDDPESTGNDGPARGNGLPSPATVASHATSGDDGVDEEGRQIEEAADEAGSETDGLSSSEAEPNANGKDDAQPQLPSQGKNDAQSASTDGQTAKGDAEGPIAVKDGEPLAPSDTSAGDASGSAADLHIEAEGDGLKPWATQQPDRAGEPQADKRKRVETWRPFPKSLL